MPTESVESVVPSEVAMAIQTHRPEFLDLFQQAVESGERQLTQTEVLGMFRLFAAEARKTMATRSMLARVERRFESAVEGAKGTIRALRECEAMVTLLFADDPPASFDELEGEARRIATMNE